MSQYANYDYAWRTPGWSVQNPVVPSGNTNGYVDPGLPSDIALVRVFGKWLEMGSGRGLEGVLRVRTMSDLIHTTSGSQIPAGEMPPFKFRADEGLNIYLPATDDPQLIPAFKYHAKLTVRGEKHEFEFSLPASLGSVSIFDLLPAGVEDTPDFWDDETIDGGGA